LLFCAVGEWERSARMDQGMGDDSDCMGYAIHRFGPASCPHNLFARLWTIYGQAGQVAETIEFVRCASGVCNCRPTTRNAGPWSKHTLTWKIQAHLSTDKKKATSVSAR
jgi:hypothetical protein